MGRACRAAFALLMASACSTAGLPQGMPTTSQGRAAGIVLAVAPLSRTITLLDAGRTRDVAVDRNVEIRRGRETLKLGDLRRGDRIVIVTMSDTDTPAATRIAVSGPALQPPGAAIAAEETRP